jgi:hypothetical protein
MDFYLPVVDYPWLTTVNTIKPHCIYLIMHWKQIKMAITFQVLILLQTQFNFEVWGTCMGFQLLSILIANDSSVLCGGCFNSYNLPLPLDFTPLAASSRLYGNAPADIIKNFENQNITINLHHDGVYPATYQTNSRLASFVNLLSVSQFLNFRLTFRQITIVMETNSDPHSKVKTYQSTPLNTIPNEIQ